MVGEGGGKVLNRRAQGIDEKRGRERVSPGKPGSYRIKSKKTVERGGGKGRGARTQSPTEEGLRLSSVYSLRGGAGEKEERG